MLNEKNHVIDFELDVLETLDTFNKIDIIRELEMLDQMDIISELEKLDLSLELTQVDLELPDFSFLDKELPEIERVELPDLSFMDKG